MEGQGAAILLLRFTAEGQGSAQTEDDDEVEEGSFLV